MHEFVTQLLKYGDHERTYEVIISTHKLGEFLDELTERENILYNVDIKYYNRKEVIVRFCMKVSVNGATEIG